MGKRYIHVDSKGFWHDDECFTLSEAIERLAIEERKNSPMFCMYAHTFIIDDETEEVLEKINLVDDAVEAADYERECETAFADMQEYCSVQQRVFI